MSTLTLSHDQITRLFQDHREALTQFLVYKIRCPETALKLPRICARKLTCGYYAIIH